MSAELRFRDSNGTEWEVWEVPLAATGTLNSGEWRTQGDGRIDSWLCFDSGVERRRLENYPGNWRMLPPEKLEELCRSAERYVQPSEGERPEISG